MDIKAFFEKWEGGTVDYDGHYGGQCTDFARQYCFEMFGETYKPHGNALTLFSQDWGDSYIKFENTPDFLPLEGDICIWSGPTEYGHIGIVKEANLSWMEIVDQNTGSGNGDGKGNNIIRSHFYNYKDVIGFVRHINNNKQTPMELPKEVCGIPIRIASTDSKTLVGYANIKGIAPRAKKDEILIFDNAIRRGTKYVAKVIQHELFHFYQHLVFSEEQNKYINSLYKFIPNKVSNYANFSHWEDGAETYAYGITYITNGIELPKNKKWDNALSFKYDAYKKFVESREKTLIALIKERKLLT